MTTVGVLTLAFAFLRLPAAGIDKLKIDEWQERVEIPMLNLLVQNHEVLSGERLLR
jgi:hypothetical protein